MLRPALAGALLCALTIPRPAAAWTRDRVLLLIDNRSTNTRAQSDVTPVIRDLLKQKGYEVIGTEAGAAVHVDRSGGASGPEVRLAAQRAQADRVLTISIGFLLEAQARPLGPGAKPAIGMLARMYAPDARAVWRNSLAMILDEPMVRPTSKTAYVSRSRRMALNGNGESAYKSPTTIVCEQLLWTLPRARPSPEEIAARAAPPPPVMAEPVKSTRSEAPPPRSRSFGDTARFPLRLDRTQRETLDRGERNLPRP